MKKRYHRALCALVCGVFLGACGFPGPPLDGGNAGTGGSAGTTGGSAGTTGGSAGTAGTTGGSGSGGSTGGSGGSTGGSGGSTGGSGGGCTGVDQNGTCLEPPLDGAFLWLRSDAGLAADAAKLSWKDQISGSDAIAAD